MMEPGFYNMDCMDAMREFPDGFFDLAVVDPPYGDGGGNIGGGGGSDSASTDTSKRMPANRGHLGGEIRQKNYCVGRGPRRRLLSGVVSRLTQSDHMGRKLLQSARDAVLSGVG